MSPLSNRIKEARESMGWTQMQAGEIAGIDYRTIQRWELGKTKPDRHRVMGIAYLYGRPLGWFYDDNSMHQPPLHRDPLTERIGMLLSILKSVTAATGLQLEGCIRPGWAQPSGPAGIRQAGTAPGRSTAHSSRTRRRPGTPCSERSE